MINVEEKRYKSVVDHVVIYSFKGVRESQPIMLAPS